MGDETKKKTQGADDVVDPSELSDTEKDKLIRTQQGEIERLNKELDGLRKKLDDSEAAHKAVVRKAKAESLMKQWEDAGRSFDSDDAKTAEMDRLLKLTDEAFAATEAAVQAFAGGKKKPKKQAGLYADAGVSPAASPDTKTSLTDRLSAGFMAAYKDRVGTEG